MDINEYYDTQTIFNINDIEIDNYSFILLASRRKSGKTVLVHNLLKNIFKNFEINFIVVFSKTAKYNGDYDYIKKDFIYDFDEAEIKIDKILKYQEKNVKKKNNINGVILLDDIQLHKKCKQLMNLASYGRHLHLFVICSVQYPKQVISTSIRCNVDQIYFNDLNFEGIEAIYKSIHIPYKLKDFIKYVNENNDNYKFILYDNKESKKNRLKLVKATLYKKIELE